jgi:hypothetical protein
MRIRKLGLLAALAIVCAPAAGLADEARPYSEGPVVNVSFIKVEPGMFDAYLGYLATTYKALMEEQKKAGLVLEYHVYEAQARDPNDADLILTITYKNMAALDGLEDKVEPLQRKIWADRAAATKASVDRGKMRTQLGSQLIRELILK